LGGQKRLQGSSGGGRTNKKKEKGGQSERRPASAFNQKNGRKDRTEVLRDLKKEKKEKEEKRNSLENKKTQGKREENRGGLAEKETESLVKKKGKKKTWWDGGTRKVRTEGKKKCDVSKGLERGHGKGKRDKGEKARGRAGKSELTFKTRVGGNPLTAWETGKKLATCDDGKKST